MIEAVLLCRATNQLRYKNVCQLEGSDHGGRDTAAELALAGTIDVQTAGRLLQPADFGVSPSDPEIIHRGFDASTNLFRRTVSQLFFRGSIKL